MPLPHTGLCDAPALGDLGLTGARIVAPGAPGRSVLPEHPTLRFLAHLLDDFSDEWFYRPAVGSRWSYEANTQRAAWQIAEELSVNAPFPMELVHPNVIQTMTQSLPRLGVTPDNIEAWMTEVYVAWLKVLHATSFTFTRCSWYWWICSSPSSSTGFSKCL